MYAHYVLLNNMVFFIFNQQTISINFIIPVHKHFDHPSYTVHMVRNKFFTY